MHYYAPNGTEHQSLDPAAFHLDDTRPFTAEDVLTEVALRRNGFRPDDHPEGTRWVAAFRVDDTDTWLELTPRIHPEGLTPEVFDRALRVGEAFAAHHEKAD